MTLGRVVAVCVMGGLVLVFEHSLHSAVVAMSLKPTGKKKERKRHS